MEDEITLHSMSTGQSVRGMESVVATVSGYHGLERFKLIKLINFTGASYVGAMTKATTHLVCWKFEGRKYELARSFGTIIVSHRWFEDCLQAGKRLPERHYRMKSGQQVGPLSWEVPVVGDKVNPLSRSKCNALSDLTNRCKETKPIEKDMECLWSDSLLLRENSQPARGTSVISRKSGNSVVCKRSKNAHRSNNKHLMTGESSSESVEEQHEDSSSYSTVLVKHKRNVCSSVEDSLNVGPTRKSRRLVKKNACRGVLESSIPDNEQENPYILRNEIVDIEQDYFPINFNSGNIGMGSTNENSRIVLGQNLEDGSSSRKHMNEVVEDMDGIPEINRSHVANGSNLVKESVIVQDIPSQQEFPDSKENMDGTKVVDDNLETGIKLPVSSELSCVICWTDFSSTRGVLPCGHRFCYSCIHSCAVSMAARRKVSTCPLCKASFMSITMVDGGASSDQKIYSQTIPLESSADIYVLPDWDHSSFRAQSSAASVCCECRSREPEELLVPCHLCSNRLVHSYCLDPPLFPWTCNNCRNLRMLYLRNN